MIVDKDATMAARKRQEDGIVRLNVAFGVHPYVPPVRPALPKVSQQAWPVNPIDDFILARLEQEKEVLNATLKFYSAATALEGVFKSDPEGSSASDPQPPAGGPD